MAEEKSGTTFRFCPARPSSGPGRRRPGRCRKQLARGLDSWQDVVIALSRQRDLALQVVSLWGREQLAVEG